MKSRTQPLSYQEVSMQECPDQSEPGLPAFAFAIPGYQTLQHEFAVAEAAIVLTIGKNS